MNYDVEKLFPIAVLFKELWLPTCILSCMMINLQHGYSQRRMNGKTVIEKATHFGTDEQHQLNDGKTHYCLVLIN